MPVVFEKLSLQFLKSLAKNNNRDWFLEHKDAYLKALANTLYFFDELIVKINIHDHIQTQSGKESIYRIYNDVRFSKDKTPYNPRFAGYIKRQKPELRGGYTLWITPGHSRVRCGFSYPNPADLKRIRLDISDHYIEWRKLLNKKSIQNTFGKMKGEKVKIAPQGFPKDHPAIDLLRYKQFWFEHPFTDREVLAPDFLDNVNKSFKAIRPFFDYMSEILTTDLNGESIFLPKK